MIPKTIVQTHRFEEKDIPPYIRCPMDTWQELNQDFSYHYFGQKESDEFMSSFSVRQVSDIYFNPKTMGTLQADIFRACVIYEYGGVYADSDLVCLGRIFEHVNADASLSVTTEDNEFYKLYTDFGYSVDPKMLSGNTFIWNAFFASEPKHPYFEFLFDVMIENVCTSIKNQSRLDPNEIGVMEVGVPAWSNAMKLFFISAKNSNTGAIDIAQGSNDGLFIDIGGSTTWNDWPLTPGRLEALPRIFNRMNRGHDMINGNSNKNVGSFKIHINDGHGNFEYRGR